MQAFATLLERLVLTAMVYTIGSAGGESAGPVRLTMAGVA
ncbi:MAG: Fe(3+)-siderophore ABC transporter permease, partial [Caulobacteraceae bacterium]